LSRPDPSRFPFSQDQSTCALAFRQRIGHSSAIAILVLAEKVVPVGRVISRIAGAGIFAGGAWMLAQALPQLRGYL
jgi:hypothetical protein